MTASDAAAPIALEARGITKRFPAVVANDDVSIQLRRGEILGLLGENGAGKSTLVKMLFGLYHPDDGEILINGEVVHLRNPGDAIARGLGMVHQHFQLVPVFTVAENIMLGAETHTGPFLDVAAASTRIRELSVRYGLTVDPSTLVEDLPVGTQQRVEILKALYRDADILILDEPTAVLTPAETDELLETMRELASTRRGDHLHHPQAARGDRGVRHDHRAARRQGRRHHGARGHRSGRPGEHDGRAQRRAAGREGRRPSWRASCSTCRVSSSTTTASTPRSTGSTCRCTPARSSASPVSRATASASSWRRCAACVRCAVVRCGCDGRPISTGVSVRDVNRLGVAHIPEDREKHGFVGSYSVASNLVLERFDEAPYANGFIRDFGAVEANATELVERFDVRPRNIHNPMSALSGGNKQKVIVARELTQGAKLVIAAQPTRGVDVGSIEFIHRQLVEQRDAGVAVLVVSAELDEVLSLSDRVAVIYEGRIQGILPVAEANRERIGLLMAGDTVEQLAVHETGGEDPLDPV